MARAAVCGGGRWRAGSSRSGALEGDSERAQRLRERLARAEALAARREMQSAAAPVVGNMDLLGVILRKLPLPDLLACAGVTKQWESTVREVHAHPQFWRRKFRWELQGIAELRSAAAGAGYGQPGATTKAKVYSPSFEVATFPWRLLAFPAGNQADHLSIYLDASDATEAPSGWFRGAKFSLTVVNQTEPALSCMRETEHTFDGREVDWGFREFIPLEEVYAADRGFLVNDKIVVEVDVTVCRPSGLPAPKGITAHEPPIEEISGTA